MTVTIAEVLDQDGETWTKSNDPTDPPGWYATIRGSGAVGLRRGERLRAPCGAVVQVAPWYRAWYGVADLHFSGEARPPHLEAGMVLEVCR